MAEKTEATEWTTVSDGTTEQDVKIVVESIGEAFTGTYLGMRNVDSADGSYKQARFELDGATYFINANHSLREGLKTVRSGALTRITWVDELDTGQAQPMRVFSVETARAKGPVRRST